MGHEFTDYPLNDNIPQNIYQPQVIQSNRNRKFIWNSITTIVIHSIIIIWYGIMSIYGIFGLFVYPLSVDIRYLLCFIPLGLFIAKLFGIILTCIGYFKDKIIVIDVGLGIVIILSILEFICYLLFYILVALYSYLFLTYAFNVIVCVLYTMCLLSSLAFIIQGSLKAKELHNQIEDNYNMNNTINMT